MEVQPRPEDWLFKSTRGSNHLTSSAVGKKIRSWCGKIGLEPHDYGTHTMRKTFGYVNRIYRGVGVELLMKRYNHATQQQTMTYLCITDNEVQEIMEEPI
jgi:integrase